jgi:NADP-dependent 3-hydroxy acid dehydrogenase YdfG
VVAVTGTSRGTGKEIARELRAAGWDVWGINRHPTPGADGREVVCDLTDPGSVQDAVREVLAGAGRLDALIPNAVSRSIGTIAALSRVSWQTALDTNLTAVLYLVQAALPALRRSHGLVLLMGSHAGSRFFEGGVAYCATKAALKAVAEVLLLEERPNGVRTTLLSPGAISNEDHDDSPFKISTRSMALLVRAVLDLPADAVVGELEVRPSRLSAAPVAGFDRLQVV